LKFSDFGQKGQKDEIGIALPATPGSFKKTGSAIQVHRLGRCFHQKIKGLGFGNGQIRKLRAASRNVYNQTALIYKDEPVWKLKERQAMCLQTRAKLSSIMLLLLLASYSIGQRSFSYQCSGCDWSEQCQAT
jgi:hypothetical protein